MRRSLVIFLSGRFVSEEVSRCSPALRVPTTTDFTQLTRTTPKGDLTRDTMRKSCNLSAVQAHPQVSLQHPRRAQYQGRRILQHQAQRPMYRDRGVTPHTAQPCHPRRSASWLPRALLKHCRGKGKDLLTEEGASRFTSQAWSGYSMKQRGDRWIQLVTACFWVKLPDRGHSKTPHMPRVRVHRGLREVLSFPGSASGVTCHSETQRVVGVLDAFDFFVFVRNVLVMKAFYEEAVRIGGDSSRGKPQSKCRTRRRSVSAN